jgi:hypothetical protein
MIVRRIHFATAEDSFSAVVCIARRHDGMIEASSSSQRTNV